jgi:predicted dithiol-disulfide oxidoreductase (DUF899 family)
LGFSFVKAACRSASCLLSPVIRPGLQRRTSLYPHCTRAYVSADDGDVPGLSIFTRSDGTIRHFWSGGMSGEMADPGQDPRGAPDVDPLWTFLDLTPAGRGATWYPQLEYASLTTIK